MISPTTAGWRMRRNSAPMRRATTTIRAMSRKTNAAVRSASLAAITIGEGPLAHGPMRPVGSRAAHRPLPCTEPGDDERSTA